MAESLKQQADTAFLGAIADDMRQWRQHIHQHPETAFAEFETADYIAKLLQDFGLDVHRGLGETGVVATLKSGDGNGKIALRADMDALFIDELNAVDYRSQNPGVMHACGHDGHCAMLLGAAAYLAEHPGFSGTVYFIFQPAEEGRGGAKRMIEDGLFERFPADQVFGMHNFPDVPLAQFAVKSGAMMAAFDCFEIILTGQGMHAAMPHQGNDPILAAAALINALQSIVSRNTDPAEAAVVSITQVHAGNTWNAVPEQVTIRGTYRFFEPAVGDLIAGKIRRISDHICAAHTVDVELIFNPENPGYPVTINSPKEAAIAAEVAAEVVGANKVDRHPTPSMGAEDFAFMLQEKPGCYLWIGNGSSAGGCLLHNPHYDFNDEILTTGAAYWIRLVQKILC